MNITWISKIEWDMPHKTSRYKLSEALIKRGHKVTLYMVKKFGEKISLPNNVVGIPTIHFPILSGIFYGLIVFFYFPILLSKKKIDFIIIDGTKVPLPFTITLKILNIPIVVDLRTLPIDKDESFSFKVSMHLSKYLVNGITTITPELRDSLVESFNLKDMKIGIWSSGVSIDDFNNIKLNLNHSNSKDTLDNKLKLIYHGDYSPTRGIENLIESISKISLPLKNEIKLMIVGMPKNKINVLSKLCEKLDVKDQINIISKVSYEKIAEYIKNSDVGVIPLPPENKWWRVSAPLKTLECLAAGVPILATNIPFHTRIFEKGNFGLLIDSGSPEVIARGITTLYNEQENLKKMGEEGKMVVESFYTWDIMAQKFEDFLVKL